MKLACALVFCILLISCKSVYRLYVPDGGTQRRTGTEFYKSAAAFGWKQRDSFLVQEILSGNLPSFLKRFAPVHVSITDSASGRRIKATYFVSPDYLCLGTDTDWARVCLTPMAAQRIADSFHCFLPTRKMVDDIYRAARVKLEPVPMYAYRDSTPTMYHHHQIVEGQRKGREGLIAGIKKDLVLSGKITREAKTDRVAIYGWHKPDGKAIQPLYTGHVNWYVDYSHGARLVYRKLKVNGKWMDYVDVLKHPLFSRFLCDEAWCDFYRYESL